MTKISILLATFLFTSIASSISHRAAAAEDRSPMDPVGDQLRDQLNDVVNKPYNFCDPATDARSPFHT